jgi:hypothetical protein
MDSLCDSFTNFFKLDVVGKLLHGDLMASGKEIPAAIIEQAIEIGKKLS